MNITVKFTDEGVPKTGLTPEIDIWEVETKTKVVDNQNMVEIGGGNYKYNFSTYNPTKEYIINFDGTSALNNYDRYKSGDNYRLQMLYSRFR